MKVLKCFWRWFLFLVIAQISIGETTNSFSVLLEKARNGDAEAQAEVGKAYAWGEGVATNDVTAQYWYDLSEKYWLSSIENSDSPADGYFELARQCAGIGNIGCGQFFESRDKWRRKSVEYAKKAAGLGHVEAHYDVGNRYYMGFGCEQNHKVAVEWMQIAADLGHVESQCSLGYNYRNGIGVPQNLSESVKWFQIAALGGDWQAQEQLSFAYWSGNGVLEDFVEGYAWVLVALNTWDEVPKLTFEGVSLGDPTRKEMLARKKTLQRYISNSQIAAGQQRAKELQSLIERKKAIAESDSDKPLTADIAPSGFGSGLLVKGGYVITCWHVIDGAERVSISVGGKDHVAKLVQKDVSNDIAILKVANVGEGAPLSLSGDMKLGEKIFTLGYPHPDLQGSDVKFTTGSISSLTGIDNSPRYFQISAPVQSGNSGGPLFDEQGNLVGVVAAKLDSLVTLAMTGDLPQNVNYAIKADYLIPVLKTVAGLEVGAERDKDVNLLELIEELKKSVVMIKVY